jgi:UDP-N-acetylmuramate dehydrogenase
MQGARCKLQGTGCRVQGAGCRVNRRISENLRDLREKYFNGKFDGFIYFYKKRTMEVYRNISLKKYNTFGLDYMADRLIHIQTEEDAQEFASNEMPAEKPLLILGSGSNILFTSDFKGTILHPCLKGISASEKNEDHVIVSAGAGVVWDDLVKLCVENGLSGLENLSLIPGMVGATPVQNIGAYGVEAGDLIENVRAVNLADGSASTFNNHDCEFGYRNSIFKVREKGKWLITNVSYRLSTNQSKNLNYGSLRDEVEKLGAVTLKNIRKTVISIRQSKLPDPAITGNAGSFFKNPVVEISQANVLKASHPDLPVYVSESGGTKLAAGWLIEKCGWKGKRIGDAGVHEKQALVIVNFGNASGREIFDLSEEIRESVLNNFGVSLEREVEVIGAI